MRTFTASLLTLTTFSLCVTTQPLAEACPKRPAAQGDASSPARLTGWRGDLKQALTDARAAGRPAVVFLSAASCDACDRMVDQTLTDARVQTALQGFVAVHVDVDQPGGSKVAKALGVSSVPALVFFSPKGALLDAMTVAQFISVDALLATLVKVG